MAKSRSRQTSRDNSFLIIGGILIALGIILLVSALDLSKIIPLDLTYSGPLGELKIDSFSPDAEQRLFVGFLILSGGTALLVLKNKRF